MECMWPSRWQYDVIRTGLVEMAKKVENNPWLESQVPSPKLLRVPYWA